ncbi:Sister chromatid cohesion protein 2 [Apophysomyces ossiformis]|uniref:Sister chromatid cohesion protein n=1 Tax=Apophysomyces ossiformis TaxID=679940 RepID=A0A8H7EMN8_9FUNG|nr:Sister chromatid cohesion protein 2 [Apophysomyces ossiformis]
MHDDRDGHHRPKIMTNKAEHAVQSRNHITKAKTDIHKSLSEYSSEEDEEEDDIPLNQRRAAINKDTLNPGTESGTEPFMNNTEVTVETFQEQSQVILNKFVQCLDNMCHFLDEEVDNKNSDDDQDTVNDINIRVKTMPSLRKFTSLALKAAQYKCIQDVDMSKFSRVLRYMEKIVADTVDMDILEQYCELLKQHTNTMTITENVTRMLEQISGALETGGMVFDILTACKLNKQILSDNVILSSLRLVRMQLENTIYPLIDLRSFEDDVTNYEIDDNAIILIAYTSMGPFFHEYAQKNTSCLLNVADDTTAANAYEQLKFGALDMLKTLFSAYPHHRLWILEELLTSLSSFTTIERSVKRFRLKDNATIHSATEQHTLRKWALRQQRLRKDDDLKQLAEHENKLVQHASDIWKSGIESATQCASFFMEFLLSKCRSRKRDAYSVTEYRAIMESMMEDVLVVLNYPEWPVAELIMRVFTKILISQIESEKSDGYLKSLAIHWLGIIIARIKSGLNRLSGGHMNFTPEWTYELNAKIPFQINHDTSVHSLQTMYQCQLSLLQSVIADTDVSISQFYISNWGYANALLWSKAQGQGEDTVWPEELAMTVRDMAKEMWHLCLSMANDSWKEKRTKALKSLGQIAAEVPEILEEIHVRNTILRHVQDSSSSVRDAAVEVIAKYLGRQLHVPVNVYKAINTRITDTAENVRKRVVKLFREIYVKCDDRNIKIDIASKLIQRIGDDDIIISELALKATQEVLFHPFQDIEKDDNDYFGYSYANVPKERKRRIVELTGIITVAVAKSALTDSESDTSLAQIVEKTMKTCDDKTRLRYEKIFQWIIDCLFERMLSLDENGERESFIHCLTTVYSFTKTCPNLLRESQISMLQPYLTVTDESDLRMARHVLTIYRDILPSMRNHDREFMELMEKALMQLWMRGPLEMLLSCGSLCQNFDFDAKTQQNSEKLKDTRLTHYIFQLEDDNMKTELMKVFKQFLAAEETRLRKQEKLAGASLSEKVIDVDTLLGNTAEFAELGVNGSIMQRYLGEVLKCALGKNMQLRYAAFEVIAAVIHQGLAHPVLCMPCIVAADTSPDLVLRNKAYYLHKFAHDKYGAVLYSNLIEYLQAAFEYQRMLFGDHLKGYGLGKDTKTDALLGPTYDILKSKKKIKLHFLETLVKPFEFDLKTTKVDELDIHFFRFIADNMLTLEFTSSEEVLCVLYLINRVQMSTGADVLSYLQFLEERGIIGTMDLDSEENGENDTNVVDSDYETAAKASAALYILLYAKSTLMDIYNIHEREIQDYEPNERNKSKPILRNLDMTGVVDWSANLAYVRTGKMTAASARDAYDKFTTIMMVNEKETFSEHED